MSEYLKAEYGNRPGSDFPTALKRHIRDVVWHPALVLDVGSGTGDFGTAWYRSNTRVLFLDTGPAGLRYGRERSWVGYDFDAGPTPSLRNKADLVFSKSVVEHMRDVPKFVADLSAMAVTGGYVVIMAPDWQTTSLTFYDDPTHVSPITPAGLRLAAEMAGLKVIKLETVKQTSRLIRPGFWRDMAWVYEHLVPQVAALWLEKHTGWSWFRWAKQRAVLLIAMKVKPDAVL